MKGYMTIVYDDDPPDTYDTLLNILAQAGFEDVECSPGGFTLILTEGVGRGERTVKLKRVVTIDFTFHGRDGTGSLKAVRVL